MDKFIGTKELMARPMTLGDYNAYRGWEIPENEDPASEGYLVEYLDGGKPNHPDHKGYVSWSPKDVFERAYRPNGNFQDRLNIERDELEQKLEKLQIFLNSPAALNLGAQDLNLLQRQADAMREYHSLLVQRIALLAAQ